MKLTIDRFGRILIPQPLRERLGLSAGVELEVEVEDSSLRLEPSHPEPEITEEESLLVFTGEPQRDLNEAVKHNREQRMEQLRN